MGPRTGLAGAVVQRSLADWPVVLAAWLLLVCASTLLATGVVYGDAVATDGLHRSVLSAPSAGRVVVVSTDLPPDRVDELDRPVRAELVRAMEASGGEVARVIRTGSFSDPQTSTGEVTSLAAFESLEGIESHATLTAGRWALAGSSPIEATLSDLAARALGVSTGGRLSMVSRTDPSLAVDVAIVGTWQADPDDAFWAGDPLETAGSTSVGSFHTAGPLVVRDADIPSLVGTTTRVNVTWRGLPAIPALSIDRVDDLRTGIDGLPAHLRGTLGPSDSPRVVTTLPTTVGDVARSVLVSRSGVILLTIQFAVLAGYAIVLVAGMLVERRRSEIALMRSRGASALHLIAMAVVEALVLAVPAVLVAPLLALGAVQLLGMFGPSAGLGIAAAAEVGPSAFVVAAVAGLVSVLALTLPTLAVSASPAGARAVAGRQARTTLPQRLGLDLALVAVAGVALWQLRLYGAPLTENARGVLGLDPLLVAAPAIGLVGGAVLALRVVPRIAELGERLLASGRGMVSAMGGRQLARQPLRYTRTALLLMLAAALGTLAAAHAATWTRSQADQAAYQAAGDVRVLAAGYTSLPTWAPGPLYRSMPGVVAATPIVVTSADVGRVVRSGRIIGLDPGATAVAGVNASPDQAERERLLGELAAARIPTPAISIPGTPRRLAVNVEVSFAADAQVGTGVIPPNGHDLELVVLVTDGDGRIFTTSAATGSVVGGSQRLVVSLAGIDPEAGARDLVPTGPFSIAGIELTVHAPDGESIHGEATVRSIEATPAGAGDTGWSPVAFAPAGGGWEWRVSTDQELTISALTSNGPTRVVIGSNRPIFGFPGSPGAVARLETTLGDGAVLPVIASQPFLAQTSANVGDTLTVSSAGQSIDVRIIDSTELFAPFDPASAFLLTDLGNLETNRLQTVGRTGRANEWWLAVDSRQTATAIATLRKPASEAGEVIGREELAARLSTDPVPLGLIGVLGLGSIAAMVFAGIGFLVSSTVTTSERLGEFALLRAIGLSNRQLALWLSIESIFLLVVGLIAGSLLGVALAWLVLPFATLTQTGVPPVPAPAVVVPWQAVVPLYAGALVLFLLSVWLVRRQLPDVRITGVLRGRA
ncbi:MAG TPA: FtsX-like permease family protein [Candidatus Limnocylindrales bacterium]|nr:FtsX-like permease family protein [Candidatus Limnocylindrales bacterium]